MRVVIIGAGVAGLAIGWRLLQRGASVTVLERAQPARGATWAAAGMLAATAEAGEAQTPEAELAYQARALWPDFAREIEEASGASVGYVKNGALMIGSQAKSPDLVALSMEEAHRMEPMLRKDIDGALFAPEEAQVDNRALGDALARAFRRAGGKLVVNEAVLRLIEDGGRIRFALTQFGLYAADAFVLAAGAWSGLMDGLPPEAVPPIKPVKGEMLALVPPKGARMPTHVVWGHGVYLVPRGDKLLVGATLEDAGFDTRLTAKAEDWLSDNALALMPSLKDWRIAEHWAGLRPGSPDGLPLLGPSAVDGLFIASGQYRNGILFAPVVAETLARSVLERMPGPASFDPRRFAGPLAPPGGVH